MKTRTILFASALILGTGSSALADDTAPKAEASPTAARDRFTGSYTYVGGEAQKAALEKAIEKATDSMFFATRGIARSRLRDKTQIRSVVGFSFGGGNITSTATGITPAVSPESGSPVPYKSGGDTVQLSQKLNANGQLVQSFTADDGGRTSTYVLSADGKTLTVNLVIQSKKLPEPVRYTLSYRRS